MSTPASDAPPSFIGEDWLFNDGWSFRGAPAIDLADPAQLDSPRAWDRLLCVLAQAKRGDFGRVDVLSALLAGAQPDQVLLATMYLACAVGGSTELEAVMRCLDSSAYTQAAAALALSGDLTVLDAVLARRRSADPEVRETMEGLVSQLLEPEPDRFYETGLDDDAYDAVVRGEVATLKARHGEDFRVVLGAPLRPRTLVAKLQQLADLEREALDESGAVVGSIALHLETLTALPSAAIVTLDGSGNEIVDRQRLVRYIETVEAWDAKHRPRSGRRMFFGHPVL